MAVGQTKKGGKTRYVLSRIWLPYDVLRFRYPSLTGKRALLPLYELHRWGALFFGGKAKRRVNELKMSSAITANDRAKTEQMLLQLGLK